MKRKIFTLLIIVSYIVKAANLEVGYTAVSNTILEQEPTLESVLHNYYIAVAGSKEKLEQLTSLVSKGEMSIKDVPNKVSFEIKYKTPNKYISKFLFMGKTTITGFDGKNLFYNMSAVDYEDQLRERLLPIKGISELYYTSDNAVFDGKEMLAGKEVYKIIVTDNFVKHVVYFDLKTGFKVKEDIIECIEVNEVVNEVVMTKEYSDYKNFNGYKLPTKITTNIIRKTDTKTYTFPEIQETITKYKINPKLNDSEFKL